MTSCMRQTQDLTCNEQKETPPDASFTHTSNHKSSSSNLPAAFGAALPLPPPDVPSVPAWSSQKR
eukprot:scaffold36288_cov19-Tisochrysis_lutea.AAC.2